jgi:hypothetical protein
VLAFTRTPGGGVNLECQACPRCRRIGPEKTRDCDHERAHPRSGGAGDRGRNYQVSVPVRARRGHARKVLDDILAAPIDKLDVVKWITARAVVDGTPELCPGDPIAETSCGWGVGALRQGRAVEGLRRRVGLHAWPLLRREEADLVAQVRQARGVDRFDQLSTAGSRLSQQEAVAAVRDRRGATTAAP